MAAEVSEKYLVVGLGMSGISSARVLRSQGFEVICVEGQSKDEYLKHSPYAADVEALQERGVIFHFSVDGERVAPLLGGVRTAILSPGVSLSSAIVSAIRARGIALKSELELGLEFAGSDYLLVTGSNGKSTTVSLLASILNEGSLNAFLCGNVGRPVVCSIESAKESRAEVLVVEASSYQLETSLDIAPKIAIFMNLTENHLERHGNMERYFEAKLNAFKNQTESDFVILNSDDPWANKVARHSVAKPLFFGESVASTTPNGATLRPERGSIELRFGSKQLEIDIDGLKLFGWHNAYNIAAAGLAALAYGVAPEVIQRAVAEFKPLRHRLEICSSSTFPGITVNDSKATTVAAACSGLKATLQRFPDHKIIPMLGGLAKAGSWTPLMEMLRGAGDQVEKCICFGEDARIIANSAKELGIEILLIEGGLSEALSRARELCSERTVLLFSPGCASFDEFRNFEERGDAFCSLVSPCN